MIASRGWVFKSSRRKVVHLPARWVSNGRRIDQFACRLPFEHSVDPSNIEWYNVRDDDPLPLCKRCEAALMWNLDWLRGLIVEEDR